MAAAGRAGVAALFACALLAFFNAGCSPSATPPAGGGWRGGPALDYDLIRGELNAPASVDRDVIDDTIRLIQKGEHTLALNRLSSLSEHHPENSALQILLSYVLLQTGNLMGAFEHAEAAHETPVKNAYACWFLGKVAVIAGYPETCRREIAHLRKAGGMEEAASKLEAELRDE